MTRKIPRFTGGKLEMQANFYELSRIEFVGLPLFRVHSTLIYFLCLQNVGLLKVNLRIEYTFSWPKSVSFFANEKKLACRQG